MELWEIWNLLNQGATFGNVLWFLFLGFLLILLGLGLGLDAE